MRIALFNKKGQGEKHVYTILERRTGFQVPKFIEPDSVIQLHVNREATSKDNYYYCC